MELECHNLTSKASYSTARVYKLYIKKISTLLQILIRRKVISFVKTHCYTTYMYLHHFYFGIIFIKFLQLYTNILTIFLLT